VVSGPSAVRLPELAESIRITIRDFNFLIRDAAGNVVESSLQITLSAGVALCRPEWHGAYQDNLFDAADKALYAAKQTGRNRTMCNDPEARNGHRLVTLHK
jgi:PleD family two-component response regulator